MRLLPPLVLLVLSPFVGEFLLGNIEPVPSSWLASLPSPGAALRRRRPGDPGGDPAPWPRLPHHGAVRRRLRPAGRGDRAGHPVQPGVPRPRSARVWLAAGAGYQPGVVRIRPDHPHGLEHPCSDRAHRAPVPRSRTPALVTSEEHTSEL